MVSAGPALTSSARKTHPRRVVVIAVDAKHGEANVVVRIFVINTAHAFWMARKVGLLVAEDLELDGAVTNAVVAQKPDATVKCLARRLVVVKQIAAQQHKVHASLCRMLRNEINDVLGAIHEKYMRKRETERARARATEREREERRRRRTAAAATTTRRKPSPLCCDWPGPTEHPSPSCFTSTHLQDFFERSDAVVPTHGVLQRHRGYDPRRTSPASHPHRTHLLHIPKMHIRRHENRERVLRTQPHENRVTQEEQVPGGLMGRRAA